MLSCLSAQRIVAPRWEQSRSTVSSLGRTPRLPDAEESGRKTPDGLVLQVVSPRRCEFDSGLRSETGPRSRGESEGTRERKERGRGAAYPKGRERAKGTVTRRNARLETMAREQKCKKSGV